MYKDYFADWSNLFYGFFTLIKLMKVLANIQDTYFYVELLGQEEEGGVEMVFDIHSGFQI
jgi:hypothetical protein